MNASNNDNSIFGIKWDDITKMLQNPAVQRGIADMGRALSLGPHGTEGPGSLMSEAASQLVRRGEVSKEAAAQAAQQQLWNKAMLQMMQQRAMPQQQLFGPRKIETGIPETSSDNWLEMIHNMAQQPGLRRANGGL